MKMLRRLLVIEWEDSCLGPEGWQPVEDAPAELSPLRIKSVGWLLAQSADAMMLAPNHGGENNDCHEEQYSQSIIIPKRCIVKMTVLDDPVE